MAAPRVERRLAAILAADVVGYSRLMERDEAGTLERLKAHRKELVEPLVENHGGRIVKLMGDGALCEFQSAVEAVACAVAMQRGMAEREAGRPKEERIVFRMGINVGDVVHEEGDIYGDGVNIAARLEGLADPGGICVSRSVVTQARNKLDLAFEPMGERRVKNIAEPIVLYRVRPAGGAGRPSAAWSKAVRWRHPRPLAAALTLALIVGAAVWLRPWPGGPDPRGARDPVVASAAPALDKRRLAVLPFTNISADAGDEWFADGITEEMITQLSKIRELSVIARTSIIGYKGSGKGVAEIGRELAVGTILEGSVRRAGDQVRIAAQLIDARTQAHLWAETYDRELKELFRIQSDVAQRVAGALQIALLADVKRRVDRPGTTDPVAYDLYLKARRGYYEATPQSFQQAIGDYQAAISRDPSYAAAYAGLAELWLDAYWVLTLAPRQVLADATAAAEKALALDDELAVAHAVLAYSKFFAWDWPAAEAGFKRALELNPNSAQALDGYSWAYLTQVRGRYDEALAGMRRVGELDPLYVGAAGDLGWVLYHAGRYDAAVEQFQRVVGMAPEWPWGYIGLGASYVALRRYDEAVRWHERGVEASDGHWTTKSRLGWAYGRAGKGKEARAILDELTSRYQREKFSPMAFVFVHQGLGDMDSAFLWLERAYEDEDFLLAFLQSREFEDLWGDSRYAAMKARIGFPPRG